MDAALHQPLMPRIESVVGTLMSEPHVMTDYLNVCFQPSKLANAVLRAHGALQNCPHDTLAFSGTSGCAIAFALSVQFGYKLTYVRKPQDSSHHISNRMDNAFVEGVVGDGLRYVIVDERICTGRTVNRIRDAIKAQFPTMVCVGLLTYAMMAADGHFYAQQFGARYLNACDPENTFQ